MAVERDQDENEKPTAIFKIDQGMRSEVDLQVTTAKAYPRRLGRVINDAASMATISQEMSEACIYSYRRGGKDITGPSIRLAEIMASAWGNMRCQTRLGDEGPDSVTAIGTAWDLERNLLIQAESRRSIRTSNGERYSPDMIATTANAAASIALRNAVFRVIPKAVVDEVYARAREAAVGDLKSLSERRTRAIESFGKMGVSPERLFARLQITDEREVTLEHLEILTGIRNRLREGDGQLEDEFPEPDDSPAATKKAADAAKPKPADPMSDLAKQVRDRAAAKAKGVGVKITKPGPHDKAGPVEPHEAPPAGDENGEVRGA
jgi:hypothetical protein